MEQYSFAVVIVKQVQLLALLRANKNLVDKNWFIFGAGH
jgi:hypothetical protein